jgi:hypothetical protein
LRGAKRRSNLKCETASTLPRATPAPVIARSGRRRRTRPSAASYKHPANPDSRALRKRRGNPEDLPPTPLPISFCPRVILSEAKNPSYLAAEGGETKVRPELGKSHANAGIGPETLAWKSHENPIVWGVPVSEPWIYETVQRNAVLYCATYIDSDRDTLALLDAKHSGAKMWMNGRLVCNEPYGVAKGLRMACRRRSCG